MGRFSPKTNKATFESESYGSATELGKLQDDAELFKEEVINTEGAPRVNAPATQNFLTSQQGIFTQTNNIGEDVATSQYKNANSTFQVDADMALRRMYSVLQSKDILALMSDESSAPEIT
tara:strand:- start:301 stop:660 length:360 start_codon:yes stop_codon:yes gene_type:complete